MRTRSPLSGFRWFSLIFILGGVILFTLQLVRFSRVWGNFPTGMSIAGIPVSRMDRQSAAQILLEIYSLPVELHYNDAVVQLSPSTVGFELDLERMLAVADLERTRQSFWVAFWNYLWGTPNRLVDIPLSSSYSEDRLRNYLVNELAARYDRSPSPAAPIAGTTSFRLGAPGTSLDIERAVILIEAGLRSPTQRVVDLPLLQTIPVRPSYQSLEALLIQIILASNFDGIAGVYLLDLQTAQEVHFLIGDGTSLPVQPDAAFTAASTIKVPIMVSIFRRIGEERDPEVLELIQEMIVKSSNLPADQLIQEVIHETFGPLDVTTDLELLGYNNTFLAGFFFTGAPLLKTLETPANQRTDLQTSPDPYSQTTPSDIGMLMADIYQCAQTGGGAIIAAFQGEVSPAECQLMLSYLENNNIAVLIQAGVPDGTSVAHKHGWVQDAFGAIHDMSDAAIVFSPGGNYSLAIFLKHPQQLVWDSASKLVSDLSRAVYNYYNIQQP